MKIQNDLNEMLESALKRIDSMSIEEFELELIKAGYKPVRKPEFITKKNKQELQ